jgi:hypothetical protein
MKIVDHCKYNHRDYTYIGIGSKNRVDNLEEFNADMDQILPCFLQKVQGKSIRCIHFDKAFSPEYDKGFLLKYFMSKKFKQTYDNVWVSADSRIEVIIMPEDLLDDVFLRRMIMLVMQFSGQMVVQMFTGKELAPMFKTIYNRFDDDAKEYIKKNVLFDITYGTDCHCMTPMTQYEPLVDKHGKFYNFILFNEVDMLQSIGVHPTMDKYIAIYFNKKLSKILNEEHVNYRKAIRGEPFLFPTRFTTAEEIMSNLLVDVKSILNIQEKLGDFTDEKRRIFSECSKNYLEMDMYKWYTTMTKLYK